MASQPSTQTRRMTVEEYLALPEEKPYLEYIDGEVVPKPMPDYDHARLIRVFEGMLFIYQQTHGGDGGPEPQVRFETGGTPRFLLPDAAYWAPGKPEYDDEGKLLPPTLAVEVRSPDQSIASQRRKCLFMHEHGCDVCWSVEPRTRTVEVFEENVTRLLRGDDVLTSPHLPGFVLPLADLFKVLDRQPPRR